MKAARAAIVADEYPQFLSSYFKRFYKERSNYPKWAVDALRGVGVDLLADASYNRRESQTDKFTIDPRLD